MGRVRELRNGIDLSLIRIGGQAAYRHRVIMGAIEAARNDSCAASSFWSSKTVVAGKFEVI